MRPTRKALKNIGSNIRRYYDRRSIVQKALDELANNGPALEFVSSNGWKALMMHYKELIVQLHQHIVFLSQSADKNQAEIQKTSDFIGALEIVIGGTDHIVTKHLGAEEAIVKNKMETLNN
jgi:hypothetical protein